jgi:small subunit ribosomal protein S1
MKNGFVAEGSLLSTEENREYLASVEGLERARCCGAIVEAIVICCDSALRLHVDLGCAEGIVEAEEAVYCREGEVRKDIAVISRVGKPIAFVITEIVRRDGHTVAHLSRRQAQARCLRYYLDTARTGDIIRARVTHLEGFGAFLDVGCGVSSLLSVDCISVSRISHPRDRLSVGMSVSVLIKAIDREGGRIYVSLRELLGTWEENAARFSVGQTVTGIIRSVESYGIFVELAPNLAGLAELREGADEELRASIGRPVAVYIKSIVPDRMKVKLILIDTDCTHAPARALPYFVDPETTHHLSRWVYSPASSKRLVESVFEE